MVFDRGRVCFFGDNGEDDEGVTGDGRTGVDDRFVEETADMFSMGMDCIRSWRPFWGDSEPDPEDMDPRLDLMFLMLLARRAVDPPIKPASLFLRLSIAILFAMPSVVSR